MGDNQSIKVMITGGGTGGHVFPAIAIADAIKKTMPNTIFLFVGATGKMEMERVPKSGYDIVGLPIAGFQRGFSIQSFYRNLSFPLKLLWSSWKAKQIIKKFQPDIVIGTGGYASGPLMRAAQNANIPTLIQEQNSYAGVTNKLLAQKANKICVAYEDMERYFPKKKIVITGNPVRTDILDLTDKKQEAIEYYGLENNKKTIVVIGGSLGARTLNDALRGSYELLSHRTDIQILWQSGKLYIDEFQNCPTAQLPNVKIRAFLDKMDLAYAAADVVVSRAGALSISELCLSGKPAVLVPSPNVAEDHQTKNAMALVKKAAARLVKDSEASQKMIPEALLILEKKGLAFSLSESIRQLGKPDAAVEIAHQAIALIKK